MNRKNFLLSTLAATPLIALAKFQQTAQVVRRYFKVNAGKGRFNEVFLYKGKHPNDIKVSSKDTDGQLSIFEYTGLDKIGPSLHVHLEQDEIFYVIEGDYRFKVGDTIQIATAGDTVFLPRKVSHTWIQLSNKGKMLYCLQPAGNMEHFFRKLNNLTKPLTQEEAAQIHKEHGMELLGPGLTL
jgi:quercetin dioxygenase-like cupin family protein